MFPGLPDPHEPRLEYVIHVAADSDATTQDSNARLRAQLLAKVDRVQAKRDDDVDWVHQAIARGLQLGTIDPAALEAATDTAISDGWDSRRLALTLDLGEDETTTLVAGFVAIDLGFAPQTGAKVAATTRMMAAVEDVLGEYVHKHEEQRRRRIRRRVTQTRVLGDLMVATVADQRLRLAVDRTTIEAVATVVGVLLFLAGPVLLVAFLISLLASSGPVVFEWFVWIGWGVLVLVGLGFAYSAYRNR
jgi:hypothetical protein